MRELFTGRESNKKTKIGHQRLFARIPGLTFLLTISVFIIALSACSGSTSTSSPVEPTSTRTPPALGPTSDPTEAAPSETPAPSLPTAAPISPVSAGDWSHGPDDAEVTILIYSDFQ